MSRASTLSFGPRGGALLILLAFLLGLLRHVLGDHLTTNKRLAPAHLLDLCCKNRPAVWCAGASWSGSDEQSAPQMAARCLKAPRLIYPPGRIAPVLVNTDSEYR